jgi:hypothetical protein
VRYQHGDLLGIFVSDFDFTIKVFFIDEYSFTIVLPTSKEPGIGKAAALIGFDGVDSAFIATIEKNAGVIGFGDKCETRSIWSYFDEFV